MAQFKFDIRKYLGTWYELAHYPSWFLRNDYYNTTAKYSLNRNGTIKVVNSTISQGMPIQVVGTAQYLGGNNLRVDFPIPEVANLAASQQFNVPNMNYPGTAAGWTNNQLQPNYVIDRVWLNSRGDYIFAVVTDPTKNSFYLLSRSSHPSLGAYNELMTYVVANYDRDRLVQTPHYKNRCYNK